MGEGQDNKSLTYYFTDITSGNLEPINKIKPIKVSEAPIMSIAENKIATSFSKIVDDWYNKQLTLLHKRQEIIIEEIISQDDLDTIINKAINNFICELRKAVDDYYYTEGISDYIKEKRILAITQLGDKLFKEKNSYKNNSIFYMSKTINLICELQKITDNITQKLNEHKKTIKTILETCDSYNTGCEVLQGAEIFGSHFTPNDKPCSIIWNYNDLDKFIPDKFISESK